MPKSENQNEEICPLAICNMQPNQKLNIAKTWHIICWRVHTQNFLKIYQEVEILHFQFAPKTPQNPKY